MKNTKNNPANFNVPKPILGGGLSTLSLRGYFLYGNN